FQVNSLNDSARKRGEIDCYGGYGGYGGYRSPDYRQTPIKSVRQDLPPQPILPDRPVCQRHRHLNTPTSKPLDADDKPTQEHQPARQQPPPQADPVTEFIKRDGIHPHESDQSCEVFPKSIWEARQTTGL
ncbi:MAG: hypothetical protein K0U66_11075, partial [Gammaproteobacteria bacterium]|nr:hypothetical protein [Gammaproteobacteria bacterium]